MNRRSETTFAIRKRRRSGKSSYRLGGYRPEFPKIRVSNTRKGFFEEPDFRVLLEKLNPWVQPPVQFA